VIQPIKIEYDLPLSAVDAFTCYAQRIGDWWPVGFTAQGEDGLDTIVIESQAGGRVYERGHDGSIYDWGVVRVYAPGVELVHSFHLAQNKQHPTEVAVRFTDTHDGCRMHFEHRDWSHENAHVRDKFLPAGGGWDVVLGAFVEFARS